MFMILFKTNELFCDSPSADRFIKSQRIKLSEFNVVVCFSALLTIRLESSIVIPLRSNFSKHVITGSEEKNDVQLGLALCFEKT